MGRKGITLEDVREAATVLQAAGQRVTSRTIREYLGTGSMGTINALMRQISDLSASDAKPVHSHHLVPQNALQGNLEALRSMYAENQKQAGQIVELQRQVEMLRAESHDTTRLRTRLEIALARVTELENELAQYQRKPKRKSSDTPTTAELEAAGQARLVD